MKGSIALTSVLLGTTAANFAGIKRQATQAARGLGFRNLAQAAILDDLNGYGCWCYFEENPNGATERTGIGYGKSNPVNAYDSACKKLAGGYECVVADQAAQGSNCEPWTVPYTQPTLSCLQSGQGATACCQAAGNSPGTCGFLACVVERDFVITFLDLQAQGVPLNAATFGHVNGFDQAGSGCPVTKGVRNPTTACCGQYPDRYPYKTLNGARQCCEASGVGITFMAAAWDCCSDGVGPNGCPGA